MIKALGLLFAVCFLGCAKPAPAPDPTVHLKGSDETLYEIAARARDTFPLFIEKLRSPAPEESHFMVKYPFEADAGSGFSREQVWLESITIRDGVYYGSIANKPYFISRFSLGEQVPFDPESITDWLYLKEDAIIGGHSIGYLFERVPR
jgi:uncharacterized protein YegJ (DUF2314 family)